MNKICMDGYRRISKVEARRRFNAGEDVRVTPCKCRPVDRWFGLSIEANIDDWGFDDIKREARFDSWIIAYTWYNCNYETGYYPVFYIKEER